MALMIRQGVALNIIVPLLSATVPLTIIAVAYFGYGLTVSPAKLAILIAACLGVGIAGKMT
jgi:hypothetical protein